MGKIDQTKVVSKVPSLLKWTGSKRSQATAIVGLVPPHERYFEPFLGGGALLYLLAKPGARAGDIYGPLIGFWKLVRDRPRLLIKKYRADWNKLQQDLPGYYYEVRARFNKTKDPNDLSFLMRTCVNGIVRFNSNGEFNNSFHLSRKGMTPDRFEKILNEWNLRLKGVDFFEGDFEETVSTAKRGDFVYMDPPYLGNKQRYIGDLDFEKFLHVLENLNRKDVHWAVSFDGSRGSVEYNYSLPRSLFKRKVLLGSGQSAVNRVLNGPVQDVTESLYLNYKS